MINLFNSFISNYITAPFFIMEAFTIGDFFERARRVRDFETFWIFFTNLPTIPQIALGIAIVGVIGLLLTFIFGALSDNHKCDF